MLRGSWTPPEASPNGKHHLHSHNLPREHQTFPLAPGFPAQCRDGSSSSLACPALAGSVGRESGTCAHNPNPTFQTLSVWRSVRKIPELIRVRNSPSPHPPAQIGALGRGIPGKCHKGSALFSCLIPGAVPPAECQFPSAALELVSLVSWPKARPCRRMGKGAVCANRGALTGPAAASPRHHFTVLRVC